MRKSSIAGIYLVTDRQLCGERGVEAVVASALQGGMSTVQLREKDLSGRAFVEEARRIHLLTKAAGVPLIINDRVDVALAVGAEGVHIGQSDLPYADVRRLMGPDAIIGLSVENIEQLAAAEKTDADYFGISPVFTTPTKVELEEAWGLDGLLRARSMTDRPLAAIGGINAANAHEVCQAGADVLAVVSAICAAPDVKSATREMIQAVST